MAKSIFDIGCVLEGKQLKISEISTTLTEILIQLSKVDSAFLNPTYVKGNNRKKLHIQPTNKSMSIEYFNQLIIQSFKEDILNNDGEPIPTKEYSRPYGFLLLLEFHFEDKQQFAVFTRLGSKEYQDFKIFSVNKTIEHNFDWYGSLLKNLVEYFSPSQGAVTINLPAFNDKFKPLEVWPPLGWITYFSNDYGVQIPDDLKGIEYEFTDKGKYLILTREDFTISKEAFEEQRDKLIMLMSEIKRRVAEYSK
ncbi:MAG: hypothetical protein IPM74_04035 [Crocinitomicaceae bacterium]|nr:hypothetical protein [Crocinitomicaceae bacterium]MBK8925077.1 hypothetical protein [Crocinitomicaceae bacterium]